VEQGQAVTARCPVRREKLCSAGRRVLCSHASSSPPALHLVLLRGLPRVSGLVPSLPGVLSHRAQRSQRHQPQLLSGSTRLPSGDGVLPGSPAREALRVNLSPTESIGFFNLVQIFLRKRHFTDEDISEQDLNKESA